MLSLSAFMVLECDCSFLHQPSVSVSKVDSLFHHAHLLYTVQPKVCGQPSLPRIPEFVPILLLWQSMITISATRALERSATDVVQWSRVGSWFQCIQKRSGLSAGHTLTILAFLVPGNGDCNASTNNDIIYNGVYPILLQYGCDGHIKRCTLWPTGDKNTFLLYTNKRIQH